LKQEIAAKLVVTIPRAMRVIRQEMRKLAQPNLSIPQFRVLAHVNSGTNTTSELAELHGTSVPAMSKVVDGLVKRGLLQRVPHPRDRRVIELELTTSGKTLLHRITRIVKKKLAELVAPLPAADDRTLLAGLKVLERILP
jgi:DNA-binding MarR family transcriptional regulator